MFITGKIVDWDRRKTEEAMDDDSWKCLAKNFGLGALEGFVDVSAFLGAVLLVACIANKTKAIIKK